MATELLTKTEKNNKTVDVYEQIWNERFALLQQFLAEKERFPKQREDYQGVKLGGWCNTQANNANNNKLPAERRKKLESIGFFDRPTFENRWRDHFSLFKKFIEENNRFPVEHEMYQGFDLGRWMFNQMSDAQSDTFPANRREKLESIGFFERPNHDEKWEINFNLLKEYIEKYNVLPRQVDTYKGETIGNWMFNHRTEALKPNYPIERFRKLQAIGVIDPSLPEPVATVTPAAPKPEKRKLTWDERFMYLERFFKEHQRLPLVREKYEDVLVGNFITKERQRSKRPNYSSEHYEKLDKLGVFDVLTDDEIWEANFELLKKFIDEKNGFPQYEDVYHTKQIGHWCDTQDQRAKNNLMPLDRREKLESIGFFDRPKRKSPQKTKRNPPLKKKLSLDERIASVEANKHQTLEGKNSESHETSKGSRRSR